jgi:hypothetical protein
VLSKASHDSVTCKYNKIEQWHSPNILLDEHVVAYTVETFYNRKLTDFLSNHLNADAGSKKQKYQLN